MWLFLRWVTLFALLSVATWNCERFFSAYLYDAIIMQIHYTTRELIHMNSCYETCLAPDIYLTCAELGIIRRPRYVHRGSRSLLKTTITTPGSIPTIWSITRRNRRSEIPQCGANTNNFRHYPSCLHTLQNSKTKKNVSIKLP